MTFWEIFTNLCEGVGKKPNPVGKEIGISSGMITKWKNGSIPSGANLAKIADYFNVTVDYLLGTEPKPSATVTDDDLKFALFNGADGITDEMYEEVKAFAEFVKNREENKRKG